MMKEEQTAQKQKNNESDTEMDVECTVDSSPQNEDSSAHHNNNNNSNQNNSTTTTKNNNNMPSQTLNGQTTSQHHNNTTEESRAALDKHEQQLPGNNYKKKTTTTKTSSRPPSQCENPTHNTAEPNQNQYTPNKKHGVIFEAVEGLSIEQYLREIADKIGGSNIKYASRLGGGRICIYLAAETYVKQICTPGGINIGDNFIQCRPYIMASKRVVLSNVLPDIPDDVIQPLLQTFGKPTSQITQLPISTTHPDLKHIKSFRRLVYMIIPNMEKMPSTLNIRYDGVAYVIYVTSDDVTCTNCQKPGHLARNCHTTAQERLGPITFADLAAGRRKTHTTQRTDEPTAPSTSAGEKQETIEQTTTHFPVLTQHRQRLRPTATTKVITTPKSDTKDITTLNVNKENPQEQKNREGTHTENCQVEVSTNNPHPSPTTINVNTLNPNLSTHMTETKLTQQKEKQQQLDATKEEQAEQMEGQENSDAESLSSNDPGNSQEEPISNSQQAKRHKIMTADHKAIDRLCESLKGNEKNPISTTTLSHFLKACRGQKEPKTIAKDHTTNITGLIDMLEENLFTTKDYNLRRRMKRILEGLKQ
ncbi:uncharacterized protein LOC111873162 [Cryptotermes secundus]|uniref:uncharacterized protein LOC111873162 n=1 Tax=Cryptotermes secundus TaxID=105785 RepID=UPI000CD7CE69|nr:uncharacterized protein LOC111873162 [Cryptotermes secundus]